MEEGVAESENFNEKILSRLKKVSIMKYVILFVLMFILILFSFAVLKIKNVSRDTKNQTENLIVVSNLSLDFCVTNFNLENISQDCMIFFASPSIQSDCYSLSNKDRCLLMASEINFNFNYCEDIEDDSIKQECLSNPLLYLSDGVHDE